MFGKIKRGGLLFVVFAFACFGSAILATSDGDEGYPVDVEEPAPQVCFCAIPGVASIKCKDCDNEPNVNLCQNHDTVCTATAVAAGRPNGADYRCTTGK